MEYVHGFPCDMKDMIMTLVQTGIGRRIIKVERSQILFDQKMIEKICQEKYDVLNVEEDKTKEPEYRGGLKYAELIPFIAGQGEFDIIGVCVELLKLGHFDDIVYKNHLGNYAIDEINLIEILDYYEVYTISFSFDNYSDNDFNYYSGKFILTDPDSVPKTTIKLNEDNKTKTKGVDMMTYEEMIEMPKTLWTEDEAAEELIKRGFGDTILMTTPGGDVIDELALANLLVNQFDFKIGTNDEKGHDTYEGTFPPVAMNFTQHYDL